MTVIAVDIGGTFTDVCCLFEDDGARRLAWTKEPSTRSDPVVSVVRGVQKILRQVDRPANEVTRLLHGTTIATNAVLERRGAVVGLLATEGFADTIEIGRGNRSDMYRLDPEPETPGFLAPARRRRDVRERMGADGEVVVPLDEAQLESVVRDLVEGQQVEAIAVCYLFSYLNPEHELRTGEIIRRLYPDMPVSLSHVVDPVFREYERTCLTAMDAYLRPVMTRYLRRLENGLGEIGVFCDVLTMQSRGSMASTRMAIERPVTTLLSGPAGGVVGARKIAVDAGFPNCVTLDMGGTSADIALIAEGKTVTTLAGRIEQYPMRTPMVDVSTVGAGGGSIVWLDSAGGLRVGPRSAGSEPGPACYGRGGTDATVTDASVVLGYLLPEYFAGDLRIDPDAAWRAVERIADKIGLPILETAAGIHRIVNARMADETRLVSLRRGYDPREFAMMLFGGGGPVLGWAVARELGIRTALVPFAPGTLCAYGLLGASIEHEDVLTFKVAADEAVPDLLEQQYQLLHAAGQARILRDGVAAEAILARRLADMRYVGQSFELQVDIEGPMTAEVIASSVGSFHGAHRRVHGHASDTTPVEFVNLRTIHAASIDGDRRAIQLAKPAPIQIPSRRKCYFRESGLVDVAVLQRDAIAPDQIVHGPAVIHQSDTTTVVGPQCVARADRSGNLIIAIGGPNGG